MVLLLILLILGIGWSQAVMGQTLFQGSACTATDRSLGVCAKIHDCAGARAELASGKRPTLCSFQGFVPIVCCSYKPASALASQNDVEPPSEHLEGNSIERQPTLWR